MSVYKPVTYVPKLIEAAVSGSIRRVDGKEYVSKEGEKVFDLLTRLGKEGYAIVGMVVTKDANSNQSILWALQLEIQNP